MLLGPQRDAIGRSGSGDAYESITPRCRPVLYIDLQRVALLTMSAVSCARCSKTGLKRCSRCLSTRYCVSQPLTSREYSEFAMVLRMLIAHFAPDAEP